MRTYSSQIRSRQNIFPCSPDLLSLIMFMLFPACHFVFQVSRYRTFCLPLYESAYVYKNDENVYKNLPQLIKVKAVTNTASLSRKCVTYSIPQGTESVTFYGCISPVGIPFPSVGLSKLYRLPSPLIVGQHVRCCSVNAQTCEFLFKSKQNCNSKQSYRLNSKFFLLI